MPHELPPCHMHESFGLELFVLVVPTSAPVDDATADESELEELDEAMEPIDAALAEAAEELESTRRAISVAVVVITSKSAVARPALVRSSWLDRSITSCE